MSREISRQLTRPWCPKNEIVCQSGEENGWKLWRPSDPASNFRVGCPRACLSKRPYDRSTLLVNMKPLITCLLLLSARLCELQHTDRSAAALVALSRRCACTSTPECLRASSWRDVRSSRSAPSEPTPGRTPRQMTALLTDGACVCLTRLCPHLPLTSLYRKSESIRTRPKFEHFYFKLDLLLATIMQSLSLFLILFLISSSSFSLSLAVKGIYKQDKQGA